MVIINNQKLYDHVKEMADGIYKKNSAYKSGYIVKLYKQLGGTYTEDNKPKKLKNWYKEDWESIVDNTLYPVYRPTIKLNKSTPLLKNEIDINNLKEQIKLKQKIKGNKNLPKFKPLLKEINKVNKINNEILNIMSKSKK
jgi:hypothetical protein